MLAPRRFVERCFGPVEEDGPLLRGDHLHLEATRARNRSKRLVGPEGLPIDDRIGHDDDAAPVVGEQAPHLAQARAHLFSPELDRLVEA